MAKSGGKVFYARTKTRERFAETTRPQTGAAHEDLSSESLDTPAPPSRMFLWTTSRAAVAEYKLLSPLGFSDETNCSIINGRELCCSQAVKLPFLDFFPYLKK